VILAALIPPATRAQNPTLVIQGGTLIDGTGGAPLRDAVIVIEGSRIRAVGARGSVTVPAQARLLHAEGKTILPGLIDSHIHFLDFTPPLFLRFGVTTVYDTANPTEWILAQRDAIQAGKIQGPRMYVTGWIIDGPEERSDMTANAERGGYRVHAHSAAEARQLTRDLIRLGVDAIKAHEGLTLEMWEALLDEAHQAGLEVVGHTHDPKEAVEAGFKFIEHGEPLPFATISDPRKLQAVREGRIQIPEAEMETELFDPLIALFLRNGVYFNPTLSRTYINVMPKRAEWSQVALKYLEDPSWQFIPKPRYEDWLRTAKADAQGNRQPRDAERRRVALQKVQEFARRYAQAGGKVLTGPDTGSRSGPTNMPGLSMHIEMESLVDAGLTPMQAILGSTRWAAELFHLEKDLGTVEAGKLADILIVNGDPLADIRATREIDTVILDGKVIDTTMDPNFRNPMPRPVPLEGTLEYMGPELSRISPRIARQGDGAVKLELIGAKFTPQSLVRFDTTDLPTVFVSDSRLTATLDGALLRNVGTYAVTVVNPGSGGGTSNVQAFVVNFRD